MLNAIKSALGFKKPIELHLYTFRSDVFHNCPIKPAKSFMPDWWKKLPTKTEFCPDGLRPMLNMRFCTGMTDLFTKGFMIPLWSDIRVKIDGKNDDNPQHSWQYADLESEGVVHDQSQRGEYMPDSDYCHIKLESPWLAECSEDIDFLLLQNTWCMDQPEKYFSPAGVLNFKHQSATNINLLFAREDEGRVIQLNCNDPLVQLIPLSDRPVKIKMHFITKDEAEARKKAMTHKRSFTASYLKHKKNKNKCPFSGFGAER